MTCVLYLVHVHVLEVTSEVLGSFLHHPVLVSEEKVNPDVQLSLLLLLPQNRLDASLRLERPLEEVIEATLATFILVNDML